MPLYSELCITETLPVLPNFIQEYPPITLGDGNSTSFTITGRWNNPYPDVRLYLQGKLISVDSMIVTSNGSNSLIIASREGSPPVPFGALVAIVSCANLNQP